MRTTASSRVYRANAIVLRRINLGETDKIVTLLTREKGKLGAVAKGARRPTSRLAGATELFGFCRMLLATGQSLDVVTQVEVREAFPTLRHSLERITAASYMAELTDHFTEDRHPNAEVFDLLLSGLYVVSVLDDVALAVAGFSLQVLSSSGYTPTFEVCARCQEIDNPLVGFSPSLGGAVCRTCAIAAKDAIRISPQTIEIARSLLRLELAYGVRAEVSDATRAQLLKVVRSFLLYRLDRPLQSTRFLDELMAAKRLEAAA